NRWTSVTAGADGLLGITKGPILGLFEFDIFRRSASGYSLVVLSVAAKRARQSVRAPVGLCHRAIMDHRRRAACHGVPPGARLVAIYTLAAVYAGIAGGLVAQTSAFVSLDVFAFQRSADVLMVLVIGGAGYLYGGLIGALGFKLVQKYLSVLTPQYWQFW